MTEKRESRAEGLRDLFDQSLEEQDPEMLSPLYMGLRSLQNRYVDPQLIAVGGMKRILKVMDRQSNRHVAMARLHDDASDLLFDPFIREARLTALLEHPNVISVHDVGVDDEGQPYFTMELKIGDGLDDILDKALEGKRYPLSERLDIFLKVCDAIAYAHSRNVIHLDIKPANVQVGTFGEVRVCDWGLGKLIGDIEEIISDDVLLNPDLLNGMTMTGEVKGTPGYMAPEQICGEKKDERADIYALGALLYAVLTCKPAMSGNTEAVLTATLAGNIQSPVMRDPNVPESLSSVVMKAMELNPEDRYQTVTGLIKDIRAFLNGFSPVAHETNLTMEAVLFYRRHRTLCNVVAGFVAVVIFGTALFVKNIGEGRAQAEDLAQRLNVEKQESEALLMELGEWAMPHTTDPKDEDMFSDGKQVSDDFFYQSPLLAYRLSHHSLSEIVRTKPEFRNRALSQLGYLYFITADFQKSLEFMAADLPRLDGLYAYNKTVAESFDPELHKTSASEIAKVVRGLNFQLNRRRLAEKVLAYDYASIGFRPDYELAVNALFRKYSGSMKFDPDTSTVTIQGMELRSLKTSSSNRTPLRFLPARHLVLENTGITNGRDLNGLKTLVTADLRGSKITVLPDFNTLPNLSKIIVYRGQLKLGQAQKAPPEVELVEAALPVE